MMMDAPMMNPGPMCDMCLELPASYRCWEPGCNGDLLCIWCDANQHRTGPFQKHEREPLAALCENCGVKEAEVPGLHTLLRTVTHTPIVCCVCVRTLLCMCMRMSEWACVCVCESIAWKQSTHQGTQQRRSKPNAPCVTHVCRTQPPARGDSQEGLRRVATPSIFSQQLICPGCDNRRTCRACDDRIHGTHEPLAIITAPCQFCGLRDATCECLECPSYLCEVCPSPWAETLERHDQHECTSDTLDLQVKFWMTGEVMHRDCSCVQCTKFLSMYAAQTSARDPHLSSREGMFHDLQGRNCRGTGTGKFPFRARGHSWKHMQREMTVLYSNSTSLAPDPRSAVALLTCLHSREMPRAILLCLKVHEVLLAAHVVDPTENTRTTTDCGPTACP